MPEKLTLEKLKISEKIDDLTLAINNLTSKVEMQNGRIGKLEHWRAFLLGVGSVLVILIVPIFLYLINSFIK